MNPSARVRCTSQQAQLATGQPCGWQGYRKPHYQLYNGRTVTIWPTTRPCPHCGSRVEEIPA